MAIDALVPTRQPETTTATTCFRWLFLCCCAGYFSTAATPAISLLMRFDVSLPVCWLFLCVFAGYFSAVWLTVPLILRCDIVNLIRC